MLLNIVVLTLLVLLPLPAQEKPTPKFEMTNYVVGLFRKGPSWTAVSTPEVKAIGEGHMANIRKMADTGKLAVAGPFMGKDSDLAGMLIFTGCTIDEARAMVAEDPAVKAGRLVIELHPWFAGNGLKVDGPKQ